MLGSEFAKLITGKDGIDRESLIYNAAIAGSVPSWIKDDEWKSIYIVETVAGVPRTLKLWVTPDYFAIGTSTDFLRMPMRPTTAQKIADHFHAILPTRKIVDAIYEQADVKTSIGPPKGLDLAKMGGSEAFIASNAEINARIAGKSGLVAGGKKDLVIGPNLDGSHLAIYSSPFSGSGPVRPADYITKDGLRIPQYQSYPSPHVFTHVDYSHGLRMVFGKGELDGKLVDLFALFQSPLFSMVSDQGSFVPRFPSVAPGSGGGKVSFPPKDPVPPTTPPVTPTLPESQQAGAGGKIVAGSLLAFLLLKLLGRQ